LVQTAAVARLAVISVSGQEQFVELHDAPVASRPAADLAALSRATGFQNYLARVGATPLAVALTVFGIFLPVVIVPYGFSFFLG
jgi:hypothetical protein